ncbi:MAG TPA: DUF1549 domain-containing protein [Lacipirellulaceae bacterium]|nr:DUF1549 domain-containing protein [Lacipirellulaceae bacterium]
MRTIVLRTLARRASEGIFAISLACASGLCLLANEPTDEAPVALHVFPSQVSLSTTRDSQSIVVQAEYASGITREVTDKVEWKLDREDVVARDGHRLVPRADGAAKLTVTFASQTVEVPVTVAQATVDPPISFKLDVMPVFMKAGCNAGSCHGAARGKDGFRLSLFGFDPDGDYYRLTREQPERRLDLSIPSECLLIEKATGQVPHSGGSPTKKGDPYHATLLRWLESGAPGDPGAVPTIESVELYPPSALLDGASETQQLTVRAKYSDGTDRDVTNLAVFLSSNDNSATVAPDGKVTAANRGEAFIMARYEKHTVGVPFITLPKGLEFQWNEVPANNYIDELVYDKLKRLRIQPSELCSDTEFIRRVSLDICGMLPTAEETEQFVADADPAKREKLVDTLLERKEFVEMWVMKWSELLQIRSTQYVSYKATLLYYTWLQEQIVGNVPINEMVQKLLSAQGGTFSNPATNYFQAEQDRLKTAENVAQVFMGMRVQCAQCHNHPFDRWTMDDYYSFAAFFAQIGRKAGADPRETIVFNSGGGEVNHLVGGRAMPPKFLGGAVPDVAGRDRRAVLAEWLASSENPFFAKNLANIVWAHFFGRGIVHEVDDVRVSNPPVNGPLLETLGQKFTEYKYDFKRMVRDICTSRTYQMSTIMNETNAEDERNFSHAALRRIRAEILLDVISQVTETKDKFAGLPLGARAVQIADGNTATYFLTTFGRATRETVCSCEVKMEPNLGQALHLMNGESVHEKIKQGGVVARLLEAGKTPQQVADELYLRSVSRKPTEEETAAINEQISADGESKAALEDVLWALLNSREFLFNH